MHDARDAEDKRLLEAGEHTQLLENYVYLVQEWVARARVRDRRAAEEVVQRVFLRLASELAAGKSYSRALPGRRLERRELDCARLRVESEGGGDAAGRLGRRGTGSVRGVGGRARPRPPGSPTSPDRDREVLDLLYREGLVAGAGRRAARDRGATPSTRRRIAATGRWRRSLQARAVDELFAEYAAAYGRGERPRAGDYLARAARRAATSSRR